jgi:hypothetical protein
MSELRFRIVPEKGSAARLSEQSASGSSTSRFLGGSAARMSEEARMSETSEAASPPSTFTLRAQGGRVTRVVTPQIALPATRPDNIHDSSDAAKTVADSATDQAPSASLQGSLLSFIERVQAMFRER